ncbi:MAG: hypothetical protein IJW57_03470 [Spirochaetaceae bacterium]|nr:hypothetical protein [Spirochaetaceae bacterium]MBQ8560597.1 hypothetical protein [Spirochaetaceae bacterium]
MPRNYIEDTNTCPEKQGCRPRFQLFLSSSQWLVRRAGVQSKGLPGGSPIKEAERIRLPRQVPEGNLGDSKESAYLPCLDSNPRRQQDGSWQPAGSKLSEDEEILAKVCLLTDDGTAFAGVYVQKEHSFNSAGLLAENFGRERGFLPPYDSGWRIPTIEELVQIYKSRLVGVFDEKKGKVWSSSNSKLGESGIRYLDIEANITDHTTPDHAFGVILIRKLGL